MYLSLSYWIFGTCRLKKHAYAELLPGENNESQAKSLRANRSTRNSALLRALGLVPGLRAHYIPFVVFRGGIAPPYMKIQNDLYNITYI